MIRLLFFGLLALSSCAPVYVPNLRNSPMFTKGGEVQGSVQVGNGLEVQTAAALNNHLALMANYSLVDVTEVENTKYYRHHQFFEGAIGFFTNKDDSFFEVFVGYGNGKGTTYEEYDFLGSTSEFAATGRYERYFIQPAIGINKNAFQFSIAPRVSMVDFYRFSTELVSASVSEEPKFLFEPAFIGRANFANNNMFFTFQSGFSWKMSEHIYFDRRTFQIGGGLGVRIGGQKPMTNRL